MVRLKPKAIVLSGGPASVTTEGSPRAPQSVFDSGLPILSICYGQQTTAVQLGGVVEGGHAAEFGRAEVDIKEASALFDGVWQVGKRYPVWMSHGDRVTRLPDGFTVKATSENAPFAVASRRKAAHLYDDVPPRGGAHAGRRQAALQLRAQDRRSQERLDDGALPHGRDRQDPRPGRQGARHLRAVGRRRFGRRLGADPRGDRRPAHLHLRRPRPAAPERGRGGRAPVPRALQHSARARRRARTLPRRAGRQVATPRPSARPSARCSSTCSTRRPRSSAAVLLPALPVPTQHPRSSSPRARSIPTSSRACRSPAARR